MNKKGLEDLSENWIDFILDIKNLSKDTPNNGVSLFLYGTEKEDSLYTGSFFNPSDIRNKEIFMESLAKLLENNKNLIPLFLASSLYSIKFVNDNIKKELYKNIKNFINADK